VSRSECKASLVFDIAQLLVGVNVFLLDAGLVVNHDPCTGGKTEPWCTSIGGSFASELGWNGIAQKFGLDWHEKAVYLTSPQAAGIYQQNNVGRRCAAFGLESCKNSGVVRIYAVDFDAGGFAEVGVERFVGRVVAGGVNIDGLLLRLCRGAGQDE